MLYQKLKNNNGSISSRKDGFTLIELMVATTLFTAIMLMGIGSLVTSSNSSKSTQKLRTAVDNVNFAMESMSRELRMGNSYVCNTNSSAVEMSTFGLKGDCDSGRAIAFIPQRTGTNPPDVVAYILSGGKLTRCENDKLHCMPIVSDDVNIENIKFSVHGSYLDDKIQPGVKIFIKGTVNINNNPTPFILQTIASQRSSEK